MLIFIFGQSIAYGALGISGSSHDLGSITGGKVCIVCHTPHGAMTDGPLWSHETTTESFTVYDSPTISTTPGQPGNISIMCLSCHDGTIAVDSFGGATGSTYIAGAAKVGTNLADDHPIGIQWDHIDPGPCAGCHAGGELNTDVKFFNGYVECASCHDPHNKTVDYKMLRKTNTGSALCLYCHGK